jgi:neurotransmitter-gated ion-channel
MLRYKTTSQVITYLLFLLLFLTGNVAAQEPVKNSPTEVAVAIDIHQIVEVNQKKKNFTAVLSIRGLWNDPLLSYEDDSEQTIKTMDVRKFKLLLFEKGSTYPASNIFNQQGASQPQTDLITIQPNGDITFLRVATITLQAPYFDFKHFPFDSQTFKVHLDSLLPESVYIFKDPINRSSISNELGEEEWQVTDFSSEIVHDNESTSFPASRLTISFNAERHNIYYVLKVFIPLSLIVLVSWFSFFLKDYAKRIDLTSSNLLIFIAFNFTIANELPKLGYITFLDYLLVSTFIITSLVILLNVKLKRMDAEGKQEQVLKIDRYVIWIYPFVYFIGIPCITLLLLLIQ